MRTIYLKSRKAIAAIFTTIICLHPLFIYFGLKLYSSRLVALFIGIFITVHFLVKEKAMYQVHLLMFFLIIIVICVLSMFLNSNIFILYLPCFISASLLASFGSSLLYPPTTVETFARMLVSELSPEEIVYCRRVTMIWILFFLLNGTTALYTACCTSLALWSLYNGLIAYIIMGLLFGAELSYRSWRFRRYAGLPTDFLFKKLFPPEA
jgi:uncharacterized membrane protein